MSNHDGHYGLITAGVHYGLMMSGGHFKRTLSGFNVKKIRHYFLIISVKERIMNNNKILEAITILQLLSLCVCVIVV